jgi:hypothetical protein
MFCVAWAVEWWAGWFGVRRMGWIERGWSRGLRCICKFDFDNSDLAEYALLARLGWVQHVEIRTGWSVETVETWVHDS